MRLRQLQKFRKEIFSYYRKHKRNLPWRKTHDPYKILISEVMLQQTQASRVLAKYKVFVGRFPNFQSLAHASTRAILQAWQGLGYNRRVLGLKKLSRIVLREFHGELPRDPRALMALPAVGSGTAGAILAFAFNIPWPFIETNIRRVFIHFFFPKKRKVGDKEILPLIGKTMDKMNPREWYFALMDYGTMLGGRKGNPNRRSIKYRTQPPFKGSNRELRGKILKLLVTKRSLTPGEIQKLAGKPHRMVKGVLIALRKERFIEKRGSKVRLVK